MNMKRKLFLVSLALVMVLSVFAAACSGNQQEAGSGGNKITMAMVSAFEGMFNPIFYGSQYDDYILDFAFDSLWSEDKNLEVTVPGLAEKWEVSEDGKFVTIHMRKDAKWHDGKPITADDMIFTWETIADPAYTEAGGSRASYVDSIKGAKEKMEKKADKISGITKVDDYTIKVEFAQPDARSLGSKLWSTPIPKHIFEKYSVKEMAGNIDENGKAGKIVGSGPYKIKEIRPNQYVVLEKNKDYYQKGKPRIDQIVWKVLDKDVAIGALKNGEIDFLSDLDPSDYDTVKAMSNVNINETQDFGYQYLGLKTNNPKLADKRVRQAIAYAINRQALVDGLLKGHGTVLNQGIPAVSPFYNKDLEKAYPHDVNKAKQLLAEAGYKDVNGDGFVEDPQGKPYVLKLDYPVGNKTREKSAPIIAEDLKKAGIKVDLRQPRDFAVHSDAVEKDQGIEMWLMGWSLDVDPDPSGIWRSNDLWNYPRWKNAESDKLIDEAKFSKDAFDKEKRKAMYKKWTELVADEQPLVFLYSQNVIQAWSKRLKGTSWDFRGILNPDKVNWYVE
ncbi:peptide/nickel transport system substrate-binding protein [Lihuaxuella thermophila]|uniref:Peptide/nickel transport system substrate-binding protein n=2 Tax=Lihuaxuella thermophila TaxID=1173111 RepID=A0A1H8HL91_9BACL|nr:peptide/nickel transport system substrate-binding protein [Lihuaxuella thermophila]